MDGIKEIMNGLMDGWMNVAVNKQKVSGGWVSEWVGGWVGRWVDGWMGGWMNGWMDEWM